jgi:riboflavin transporter
MIAAAGIFAALSIILTLVSQVLVLSFPLIPYLQFDFGEVAILLAFFLFGPVPATASAVVEFLALLEYGQNTPIGPLLKIVAILSTLGGLWGGILVSTKLSPAASSRVILGSSLAFGLFSRATFMTIANYYLIVLSGLSTYALTGLIFYLSPFFKLIGISITSSNALAVILGFTAIFNCLQLIMVFVIAYALMRLPQLKQLMRSNRIAWFESFGRKHQQSA